MDYCGDNWYFPGGSNRCSIDCLDFLTDINFVNYLEFLPQGGRKKVMTQAKSQPFCKYEIFDFGYFNGKEFFLGPQKRKMPEIYNDHICFCRSE